MKQNSNRSRIKRVDPVLEFISGNTKSPISKRVTKSIASFQSLWEFAKMSRIVRNSTFD